jgi:hypothetical protein
LKTKLFFLAFIFLFSASCLFKKPELTPLAPVSSEDAVQKKIQELEAEIRRLSENAENLKKFIDLLKTNQDIEPPKSNLPVFIPEHVDFCGEGVPLDRFRVRERLEQALINEMNRSAMCLVFLRSGRWLPLIEQKIKEMNLPEDLKYVAAIESDLNPEAYSYAGAGGLWQFIKSTGQRYLKISSYVDERLDPEKSTEAALKHLAELYAEFGNWPSALAGYNMHKDRYKNAQVKERVQDFYAVRDIPIESLQYSFRAIAVKLIMEYPDKYGFPSLAEIDKIKYQPYPIEAAIISVDYQTEKIVDIAKRLGMTYQEFRAFNPHILVKKNNYGEAVRAYLPKGKYKIYIKKTQ